MFCGYGKLSAQTIDETHVKALFLYNFTTFVQWPDSAFNSPNSPFVIGIAGRNVFSSVLYKIVEGEKVGTHPIIVKGVEDKNDAMKCHLLFFERSFFDSFHEIIPELKNYPILTVSDADNFITRAGMIRLYRSQNKIKLEINPRRAAEARLNISSKLLNVADINNEQ
jgi:hypothetical protein